MSIEDSIQPPQDDSRPKAEVLDFAAGKEKRDILLKLAKLRSRLQPLIGMISIGLISSIEKAISRVEIFVNVTKSTEKSDQAKIKEMADKAIKKIEEIIEIEEKRTKKLTS